MKKIDFELNNLRKAFPENFTEAQIAKGQTLFLKELAYVAHKFYGGKVMTVPKQECIVSTGLTSGTPPVCPKSPRPSEIITTNLLN